MAALPKVFAQNQIRRSPIYRETQAAGAFCEVINNGAVPMHYGSPDSELGRAQKMAIADLSGLPRTGFKGTGTVDWLQGQGLSIGADSNMAYRQEGGALAARLAPTEIFLIDGLEATGSLVEKLNAAWAWGTEKPRKLIGYPMPRQDSHAWFMITGSAAPEMFAKMSGIVIRDDRGAIPGFHLLADVASAEYLWGAVLDAMSEFGGAPVGLQALRRLGEAQT
jgi:sarcosine oxidase subunit gamma